MDLPSYSIPRTPAGWDPADSLADWPWPSIAAVPPFQLADGSGKPNYQTTLQICHDLQNFYLHFVCQDEDIWGTYAQRDEPIYDEEVVEFFIAPGAVTPVDYFEFELSPNGVLLDVRIHNPHQDRASIQADFAWDCPGLRSYVSRQEHLDQWEAYLMVPFESVGATETGLPETWRGNFYRIERPRHGEHEFSCWSPTLTNPADFHRPERFGYLELAG